MTISDLPPSSATRRIRVAEALIDGLASTAPEQVVDALRRGDLVGALQASIDLGTLSTTSDLIRVVWFDLLIPELMPLTRAQLERLPDTELTRHPLLGMALGVLCSADRHLRPKAGYYFGLASVGAESRLPRMAPADRAVLFTAQSTANRLMGRASASVDCARSALRVLAELRAERYALIGHVPQIYSQLGVSLYYGGREDEALEVFARGFAERGTSDRSGFGCLSMMAGIRALRGELRQAEEYVWIARGAPWSDEQRATYPGTFYRLAETLIAVERFDADAARACLTGMTHDRRSIEHWTVIGRVEGLTALIARDAARGLAELETFVAQRGVEAQHPTNRHRLASTRVLLHLALGNDEAAATVLRHDSREEPQDFVDRARLALVTGRTSDALRELRAIAGRPQSLRTQAEALVIEASVALRTGAGLRAMNIVRQLVPLMRQSGQRLALHLVPASDFEAVCATIARTGAHDVLASRQFGSLLERDCAPRLTPREQAVLRALAHTGTLTQVASELAVSANTVKTHLKSLYRKLGARNREEALTIALQQHLIDEWGPGEA